MGDQCLYWRGWVSEVPIQHFHILALNWFSSLSTKCVNGNVTIYIDRYIILVTWSNVGLAMCSIYGNGKAVIFGSHATILCSSIFQYNSDSASSDRGYLVSFYLYCCALTIVCLYYMRGYMSTCKRYSVRCNNTALKGSRVTQNLLFVILRGSSRFQWFCIDWIISESGTTTCRSCQ